MYFDALVVNPFGSNDLVDEILLITLWKNG